jgi:hypothetical protein
MRMLAVFYRAYADPYTDPCKDKPIGFLKPSVTAQAPHQESRGLLGGRRGRDKDAKELAEAVARSAASMRQVSNWGRLIRRIA